MSLTPRRLGKYELRANVGRGSILEVWKAFDVESQQDVTIKLFRPDLHNDPHFLMRFANEAKKVASLSHPNIVGVRDFQIAHPPESESTIASLVMDSFEGTALCDYIGATSGAKQFAPWDIIVQLFTAISKAMDYAHQQGVIHRNINPTNILLDTANISRSAIGEPRLTDFGMA